MGKTIRLLSALFLSMFIASLCGAAEQLTHQIDEQATAQAPWKKGEVITKYTPPKGENGDHLETRFFGVTTQGYYLVQQFYTHRHMKRSDPYVLACPGEITDKDKLLEACKITGPLVFRYSGRKVQEGRYQEGKKHGRWTEWHSAEQKREEGHYQYGEKHGLWTQWYRNGQKETEGHYKDGKKHGLWTWWHENGKKFREGHYQNGKEHGLWSEWDYKGQKH